MDLDELEMWLAFFQYENEQTPAATDRSEEPELTEEQKMERSRAVLRSLMERQRAQV